MAVPLSALLLFHSVRARRERDYPETEAEEPLMTRAEYDAMKLAKMAEATEAVESEDKDSLSEPDAPKLSESAEAKETVAAQAKDSLEKAPDKAPIQPETEVENHE